MEAPAQASAPGRYIVRLQPSEVGHELATATSLAERYGGQLTEVYSSALHGFAVTMPAEGATQLATDGLVADVQPDDVVKVSSVSSSPTETRVAPLSNTDSQQRGTNPAGSRAGAR